MPQPVPPRSRIVPLPGGLLAATVASGVAAAVFVPLDRPGLGWLLAGATIAGTVFAVDRAARRADSDDADDSDNALESEDSGDAKDRRAAEGPEHPESVSEADATAEGTAASARAGSDRVRWERAGWTGLALALLAVGVVRDAPWLFALCLVGAAVAGSLAVVPRSIYGLWFDALAVPFSAVMSVPWLYRALERTRGRTRPGSLRVWWSVAVAAALLLVVVPLLSGADAVFAALVNGLLPRIDVPAVLRWGFVFVVAGLGTAGALYLLAGPPPIAARTTGAEARNGAEASDGSEAGVDSLASEGLDPLGWMGIRRFSPVEWGIPVGALTIVFAAFVGTQIAVLFGGDGYVQRTAGLTYAEYARSGFWQLSIVSMLTLAVIGAVLRYARQETGGERRWLRGAVAVVCGLTLVIVASALHRMWTYQQAYGFTVMRLLVEVFEGWIALVYLLVLASLVRLRRGWVPRAAVGAAAVTLLSLAVLNPEGFVADRNIDRWQSGKRLDTDYLGTLSTDVLPATDRLPEPERAVIVNAVRARLSGDSWQGWNYSRATADR
ncbi:DUF4173 domain-containing protein [Nocardia sp. CDC153]|uniref:DUF4153 domain-containing protein n=1 Tax=Nocardia sp. CDC153 TaxID=3112167 RepID=UPI002DBA9785|nr:DUF4173 domain-containing protein [Nocardia sp. CDC153]MEC3956262.1 DUF4173 domain-containing protein [Nocardia sp. CDC153]